MRVKAWFFLFVSFVIPARASVWWILGAGNVTSASGVPFVTDLHLANNGTAAANLQISFFPTGGNPPFPAIGRSLAAGGSASFLDVLNQLWSLKEMSGAVRISSDQPLLLSASRHTNQAQGQASPPPTFGTDLAVIADEDLLGNGAIGDALWVSESGDPSSGFTTRFQVYLADPNVAAELRIYDATGNLVNTRPFSGGPGLFETTTQSLLTAPLALGRAELRVSNGRAAGWAEMRDNVTGDPMAAGFMPAGSASATLVVNGAWHGSTAAGSALQSDLRLFNPTPAAQGIAISDSNGKSTRLTLAPHSLQEIADVVGFLNDSPAGPVTVYIYSDNLAILGAIRTAAVPRPGSPGIYAEVRPAQPYDPASAAGTTSTVFALPVGSPLGMLVTRSDSGGGWQAALRDSAGNIIASSSAVTVSPYIAKQSALTDVFGGVNVPDGAHLEVSVQSGNVEAGFFSFASGTSDPVYREAVLPQMADCPPPSISAFSASAISLTAAGNVTLSWSVALADSVDLSPVGTGLSASSSTTVAVSQSTVFQLTAHNSCGDRSAPIGIAVGPAAPKSLGIVTASGTAGAGAAGQPGRTLRIHVDNLSDPTTIDGVLFQASNGESFAVDPLQTYDTGDVDVRVPWWTDDTQSTGYRTGSFMVGVSVNGSVTGALPFTIQPLSYSGDPVAAFRAIIDGVSSAAAAYFSAAASVPDVASSIPGQQAFSAKYEAVLRGIMDRLAANGSTTINWGAEPPTANTVTATLSTADLANIVAYNANLLVSGPVPNSSASSSSRARGESRRPQPLGLAPPGYNELNCLGKRPPWSLAATCKSLKIGQVIGDEMQDYLNSFDRDQLITYAKNKAQDQIVKLIQKKGAGALLEKLAMWLTGIKAACLLAPIELQYFYVTPTKLPLAPSWTNPPGQPVRLYANMISPLLDAQIAARIEQAEINQYLKNVSNSVNLDPSVKNRLQQYLTELLLDANGGFDTELAELARNLAGLKKSSNPQVGTCDLSHFYPFTNGPQNIYTRGTSYLQEASGSYGENQGDLDFFYLGRRPGKETFCVDPMVESFLFPDDIEKSIGAQRYTQNSKCRYQTKTGIAVPSRAAPSAAVTSAVSLPANPPVADASDPQYSADIGIGDGGPMVEVVYHQLFAGLNDNIDSPASNDTGGVTNDLEAGNGSGQFFPVPDNASVSYGLATASVSAAQAGLNTWTGSVGFNWQDFPDPNNPQYAGLQYTSSAQLWLRYFNPLNRDGNQSVHVEVKPDQACGGTGGFISGAAAQDITGKRTAFNCPEPTSCSESPTPPAWTFDNAGAVEGDVSVAVDIGNPIVNPASGGGNCKIDLTIQLKQ